MKMLKKLGGAMIVAAVAFAGMAASAAVAVQMTRGPESRSEERPAAKALAAAAKPKRAKSTRRAIHPWNEPCAAADSEAQYLVATMSYDNPAEFLRLAREGIGINVRLFKELRGIGGGSRAERALLARLERGIADDTRGLAQLQRTMSRAELKRWAEVSAEGNATLSRLARKLNAPACAEYFGD